MASVPLDVPAYGDRCAQSLDDQQPADTAVAVGERVDGLEVPVSSDGWAARRDAGVSND